MNLGVTPKLDNKQNIYYLTQDELPHTINPVESRLGTPNTSLLNDIVSVTLRGRDVHIK